MSGILSGITVVDLTQNIAGPFCTQLLGEHSEEILSELGYSNEEIEQLVAEKVIDVLEKVGGQ